MDGQLAWIGFVRAFHDPTLTFDGWREPPAEVAQWIDSRARPSIRWMSSGTEAVVVNGQAVTFTFTAVANLVTNYVEVTCSASGPVLPNSLADDTWRLITGEVRFSQDGKALSLHDLWSLAAERFGLRQVSSIPGTAFGSVAVVSGYGPDNESDDTRAGHHLWSRGVINHHDVLIERNRITVFVSENSSVVESNPWGYVLLAGLFARVRLVSDETVGQVRSIASDFNSRIKGKAAESLLERSAKTQGFALIARSWIQAASYLGHPELIYLFNTASHLAGLGTLERENQLASLEGLDRFATSLSASVSAHSQRRLNTVGFVVAVLSLLLSGVNMMFFATGSPISRQWVVLTWLAIGLTLTLVLIVSFTFARSEPRMRSMSGREP